MWYFECFALNTLLVVKYKTGNAKLDRNANCPLAPRTPRANIY